MGQRCTGAFREGFRPDGEEGAEMIARDKRDSDGKRSDLLLWLLACVLMFWMVFIGFISQAR